MTLDEAIEKLAVSPEHADLFLYNAAIREALFDGDVDLSERVAHARFHAFAGGLFSQEAFYRKELPELLKGGP